MIYDVNTLFVVKNTSHITHYISHIKMVSTKLQSKKLGSYPYFSVVLSITIALFVIGIFSVLMLVARQFSQIIKENLEIQIMLNNGLNDAGRPQLEQILLQKPYIQEGKLRFISKEDAAKELVGQLEGENFMELLGTNPLKNQYIINIKSEFYEKDKLVEIEKDLRKTANIDDVSYAKTSITQTNDNIATISFVLFTFALIMLIVVVILIHNTIRLALFSQRLIIRSMQLVGATAGFVRAPFLHTAALQGIFSGLLASGLVFGILTYLQKEVAELSTLIHLPSLFIIFAALVVLGLIISVFSSFRAVSHYLNMSLDDLY